MLDSRHVSIRKTCEERDMQKKKSITIIVGKEEVELRLSSLLYVDMMRNYAEVHATGDRIFKTRMTLSELLQQDGVEDEFVLVHRSTLVAVRAIHEVSDKIYLSNGEALSYVVRKKKAIRQKLMEKQKKLVNSFAIGGFPQTDAEYLEYYRSFEDLPFAFTDIEMVFDEQKKAIDWIFRYGNKALAELEKLPLEKMIGQSFGTLFSNMDSKWLRSYERATLYGEKLEIIDYSPEIDTYLKVICFPTFKGHCGCILFDVSEIEFTKNSSDAEKALLLYFGRKPGQLS